MKKLLLLLVFVLIYGLQNTWAYTEMGGSSYSSTWSGTVYISSHLIIENNNIVTIKPGTVIKFAHDVGLTARYGGKILADASLGESIIFTSMDDNTVGETISGSDGTPEPGDWNQMYLYFGNVYLDNVKIYYGGGSTYNSSLKIVADTTLIRNCTVAYSAYSGIEIKNNAVVYNCNIHNCKYYGVETDFHIMDSMSFKSCNFQNNKYGAAIDVYSGNVSFNNCSFENNTYEGLHINGSNSSIGADRNTHCYIDNCSFTNNPDKAVYLSNITILKKLSNNSFSNNGINGYYIKGIRETDSLFLYNDNNIPFVTENLTAKTILNIYEGVIIKGSLGSEPTANFNIFGTQENPVIITDIRDDSYGGDTNNDGDLTTPSTENSINCDSNTNINYTKFYYTRVLIKNKGSVKHSSFEKCSAGSALWGGFIADNCTFSDNNTALSSYYDTSFVTNCTFNNNIKAILNNSNIIVRNSSFSNNEYGVYVSYGSYTDLGKNSTDSIGNNIFTANSKYDITNKTDNIIYAVMNTWDGTTSSEIDSKLYDDDEDSSLGEIIFTPWQGGCNFTKLTKPEGNTLICKNIAVNVYTTTNNNEDATVKWMINPESAGSLNASNNSVTITWNLSYTGEVQLWAYPEKDCGTGDNSDTLIIHRIDLPEKPVITQTNNTLSTSEYAGYQWYKYLENDDYWEPVTDATQQTFSPSENGIYAVEVKNESNCKSMSDNFNFTFTGIYSKQTNILNIYPNPTKGTFTVYANIDEIYTITITDITGKIIMQKQTSKKVNNFNINVNKGLYFIKITNEKQNKVTKIYIE
jgi:hypothetical protein